METPAEHAPARAMRARTRTAASRASVAAASVGVSPKDHRANSPPIAPIPSCADRISSVITTIDSRACIRPRREILAPAVATTVIVDSLFFASLVMLIGFVALIRIVSGKARVARWTRTAAA